ncbi:MAG: exodeoxyribonuclease VII large subunit [Melioribacteraceae bacterium]|nr:exodeoxyribonuclease VII large subunit [Melioribacteraceae bacterium]MDD3557435.1 exodeoxyribonuclease VII large subunit [Melioribacteraceae bacterium]
MTEIYSVSEITQEIKQTLEENFHDILIEGEISNFKAHVSGHWYFSLKDKNASINCTMWKGLNSYVFFTPDNGMKVVARGRITVYPPRGTYQLDVRSLKPSGEGELQAAFERLKARLAEEGLFDIEHKKPIPQFPKTIGIVTGSESAAYNDLVSTAKRRFPIAHLYICPVRVQGEGGAEQISYAIEYLNKEIKPDVIIVARGGGSIEDLWAFNEEKTARAIFKSKIPVISGVGHEIDFTIADFAADLRAATPTAAMELATPDQNDIIAFLQTFNEINAEELNKKLKNLRREIGNIINSYSFKSASEIVKIKSQRLDHSYYILNNGIKNILKQYSHKVSMLSRVVQNNSVSRNLQKGFTIVKQNSQNIMRAAHLDIEEPFEIIFFDKKLKIK